MKAWPLLYIGVVLWFLLAAYFLWIGGVLQ